MHRWQYRSIVIRFAVAASQICEITQNSEKIQTYSSSMSSKVINLAANRKRICKLLLVIRVTLDVHYLVPFPRYGNVSHKARRALTRDRPQCHLTSSFYRTRPNTRTNLISSETRIPAEDIHRWQYVSIFISFHAIIFRSRAVSARQTGAKT